MADNCKIFTNNLDFTKSIINGAIVNSFLDPTKITILFQTREDFGEETSKNLIKTDRNKTLSFYAIDNNREEFNNCLWHLAYQLFKEFHDNDYDLFKDIVFYEFYYKDKKNTFGRLGIILNKSMFPNIEELFLEIFLLVEKYDSSISVNTLDYIYSHSYEEKWMAGNNEAELLESIKTKLSSEEGQLLRLKEIEKEIKEFNLKKELIENDINEKKKLLKSCYDAADDSVKLLFELKDL